MLSLNDRFHKGDIIVRDLESVYNESIINNIFYCPINEDDEGIETEWDNEREISVPVHTFTDVITSEDTKWGLHMFITVDKFMESYKGYRFINSYGDYENLIDRVADGESADKDVNLIFSRMRSINTIIEYARCFMQFKDSKGYDGRLPEESIQKIADIANLDKFDIPTEEEYVTGRMMYQKKRTERGIYPL